MQLIAVLMLALAAPEFTLAPAPDQPLSYVYADDPVILEIRAENDLEGILQFQVTGGLLGEPVETGDIPLAVPAQGCYWHPLESLPSNRGYYTVEAAVHAGGETAARTASFCRIDRVQSDIPLPLYAMGLGPEGRGRYALRAIGLDMLCLRAENPNIDLAIAQAGELGFQTAIYLDVGALPAPAEQAQRLATQFGGNIVQWTINAGGDTALLLEIIEAVRGNGPSGSVGMAVSSAAQLRAYLAGGAGEGASRSVLLHDSPSYADILALRHVAEEAGFEGWGIDVFHQGPAGASEGLGTWLTTQFFCNLAAGARWTGVRAETLYDGELREAFVHLSGLAQRFVPGRHAGDLALGEGVSAPLFRDAEAWLLPLWTAGGPAAVDINVEDSRLLALTDALNNPLELPEVQDGVLTLEVDGNIRYLTGRDGALLGEAAYSQARRIARAFARNEAFQQNLPVELMDMVERVARDPESDNARAAFLLILRSFPEMELGWRRGVIAEHVAIPAIAQLARLTQALCTVEQRRGEPFLQPLTDSLARCEEYQSLYLTESVVRRRGDWLLQETRRLMDLAEALAGAGRQIEADGLGSLAEWRARALEYVGDLPKEDENESLPAPPMETPPMEEEMEGSPTATPPPPPGAEEGEGETAREGEGVASPEEPAGPEAEDGEETMEQPDAPEEGEAAPEESAPAGPRKQHTVARGDNSSSIAGRYGITLDQFFEWNGLTRRSVLQIGDTYFVSPPTPAAEQDAQPEPDTQKETGEEPQEEEPQEPEEDPEEGEEPEPVRERTYHTVGRGDNPSVISDRYGIPLDTFLEWNNLNRRSVLHIGERYVVSPPVEESAPEEADSPSEESQGAGESASGAPPGTRTVVHTVALGESPYSIANKYGVGMDDFFRWNNIRRGAVLHVGEKYIVHVKE